MIRNPKHQVFADEWLIDMNGTRAYKVAYPNIKKDTTARVNASRLLTDANVKQYIDEQLEKMQNERVADAQEVLEYLTSTMRGEKMKGVYNTETTNDEGEIFTHQKNYLYTPSTDERTKAGELLGKRHALFTDKQQIEVTEMPVFVDDIGDDDG